MTVDQIAASAALVLAFVTTAKVGLSLSTSTSDEESSRPSPPKETPKRKTDPAATASAPSL